MIHWVAVFWVAALSCRGPCEPVKAPPKGVRTGVHVPLPKDWRVQVAEGENFRAGPPGHVILRIDSSPSTSPVPSVKELETKLQREDPTLSVRTLDSVDKGDAAVGIFQLSGEHRPLIYAMLGVRRVQGQTFLCSTVPGASQAEVRIAADACANLSVTDAH